MAADGRGRSCDEDGILDERCGWLMTAIWGRAASGPSYTGGVTNVENVLVQSLARNFEDALELLAAALTDCPDRLWESDLWPDEAPMGPGPYGGLAGSAPWFLAHHALFCLDYDLSGGFGPWEPPPPFDEVVMAWPTRVFTRLELLGYIDGCRGRVRRTLDALTMDLAARPIPREHGHRYHGTAFGVVLGGIPLHVVEHAAQIRQYLTAAGVRPRGPADGYGARRAGPANPG